MVRKINKDGQGRPNIVIPTIRDNEFFKKFLIKWQYEFEGCHLIIIEDRKKKQLSNFLEMHSTIHKYTYELYDWRDIDKDLGKNSWIIPRQTDGVRNYGYLMAYKNKPEFIVTLDDDLEPLDKGHIMKFYNKLFTPSNIDPIYFSTMNGEVPRGSIHSGDNEVVVAHGTWVNVADYSAKQQIAYEGLNVAKCEDFYDGQIPRGCLYSMCGMNLAWKTHWTKYMYFPLMGTKYPIDRCGDIWAGYYSKLLADLDGKVHVTGYPMVIHNRASNPWTNLKKEKGEDVLGKEFINVMLYDAEPTHEVEYFKKLKKAYIIWEELINDIDKGNSDC
ncbi:hypothetical protein [uncultured Arcobacter sp.]|uniref:hypothetical protein n=1 Tax=uncultured Arcobacter sp. TaxID=165434 RepID=UPI002616E3FD|nr:hypothetical protein [uncultured Arcobacter sp.]